MQEDSKKSNAISNLAYTTFCCCFCCWFIVSLVLGICGTTLYNGYFLAGTTSVSQIHRPSVPLIGSLKGAVSVRLTEIRGTQIVPILFYVLPQCSSQSSYKNLNVNETFKVTFDSPTEKSKGLTEWYFLENTTLTVAITTEALPNYPADHCIAFLVAFDDFNSFKNFLTTSFLSENYVYKRCVASIMSQTTDLPFEKQSYYYFGMYSDIPNELDAFSVHFSGSFLQYNILNLPLACSIDSPFSISCEFFPNANSFTQDACIVGSILPISTLSEVNEATVTLHTAANSDSAINSYFFIPFILIVSFTIFLACLWLVYKSYKNSTR